MYEDHERMIFISYTTLADYYGFHRSFGRAAYENLQQRRYENGEISYRTWVDGVKRREKKRRAISSGPRRKT